MTIVHFISSGGLFGAEHVLVQLAYQQARRGLCVSVVALNDKRTGVNEQGEVKGLEVIEAAKKYDLKTHVIDSRGRIDFASVRKLKKYLRMVDATVLHTHNYKANIIGWLASRKSRVALTATAHGYTDVSAAVSFYERIDRFVLKRCFDKVAVVSDSILPELSPAKKTIVPNAVDTENFLWTPVQSRVLRQEFRQSCGLNESDFVVGTIGRLSKEKNQLLLLEAAAKIIAGGHSIKIVCVGDGPEEKVLKQYCKDRQIENHVVWTGVLRSLEKVYAAFDVFALTSRTEGMPLTVLEAMASGVPVLVTKVGALPKMIEDGQNGCLIESDDVDGLSRKLLSLKEQHSEMVEMAQRALSYVRQNHSMESMSAMYMKMYKEILNL